MRKTLSLVCLVLFLGLAVPARAQLRGEVQTARASSKLYNSSVPGVLLNTVFNPEHFRMSHTYEMSFGSFGGRSSSLGMYTNTMAWQFKDKLAARVDLSMAFSPFGGDALGRGGNGPEIFLRNAEVAYRPNKHMQFHLQIHQSPYGAYASPYGVYSPYGYRAGYHTAMIGAPSQHDLFWKDNPR